MSSINCSEKSHFSPEVASPGLTGHNNLVQKRGDSNKACSGCAEKNNINDKDKQRKVPNIKHSNHCTVVLCSCCN